MSGKRYYWLKLDENFFEDDTITWLEEQENGKDYVLFYLKLALKSLKDDGRLIRYVGEKLIPYDVRALSKLTNTPVDTVAVAMKTFLDLGLVEKLESGEIYLSLINELVGTETDVAKRVRKHRAKKNLLNDTNEQSTLHEVTKNDDSLQCNSGVTKSNTEYRDKSLELELEKDIDTENRDNKDRPNSKNEFEQEFDEWWKLYNKKIDKKKSLQRFKSCRKKHSYEQIKTGTEMYLKTITDKKYQKHPTTFLNGESYLDVEGYQEFINSNGIKDESAASGKFPEPKWLTEEEIEESERENKKLAGVEPEEDLPF